MKQRLRSVVAIVATALLAAACTASSAGTVSAPTTAPTVESTAPSGVTASMAPAPSDTAPSSAPASAVAPSGGMPSVTPPTAPAPTRAPVATRTPGAVGGNPGVTPVPLPGGPTGSGGSPGPIPDAPPTVVTPVANLKEVHDVRAEQFTVAVAGSTLRVAIDWWSGPAPCSQLAEVRVDRSGGSFTLTVREGAEQLGIACPALAMHKRAIVNLGPLAAGVWTITVTGVDQPQTARVGA